MKNAVYFSNAGELDLRAAVTLGVNVKNDPDSAIGFFGTGLNFSLSCLLRTGHTIDIWRGLERHVISTKTEVIRGEPFDMILLDGRELGFTTSLGRQWEVWQAYRELRCNAEDEDDPVITDMRLEPTEGRTLIRVTGAEISRIHDTSSEYFFDRPVLHTSMVGAVGEGVGDRVFYRGVLVHRLQQQSLYTYNLISKVTLTEDRTLQYPHIVPHQVAAILATSRREDILEHCLTAPKGTLESALDFSMVTALSDEFNAVCQRNTDNEHFSRSALRRWQALRGDEVDPYHDVDLGPAQIQMLENAAEVCQRIDPSFSLEGISMRVVRSLGEGVLGTVHKGMIVIARPVLDQGPSMLAGTIFEEWVHIRLHLPDCQRSMQNYLIDRVTALAVEGLSTTAAPTRTNVVKPQDGDTDDIPF